MVAFLTILGFSLYDTIVVFDKVHENTKRLAAAGARPTARSSTCTLMIKLLDSRSGPT